MLVAMVTATSCLQSNVSGALMFSYRPTFIPRPLFSCLESRHLFGVTPGRGELVGVARLSLSFFIFGGGVGTEAEMGVADLTLSKLLPALRT